LRDPGPTAAENEAAGTATFPAGLYGGDEVNKCDNCSKEWGELKDGLQNIPDLLNRIEPGGIVPSGVCPDCGALCYPVKEPVKIVVTVDGGVVQSVDGIPAGVNVEVWDFDTDGVDMDDLPDTRTTERNYRGEQYIRSVWGD
jgi:hypothetical protein